MFKTRQLTKKQKMFLIGGAGVLAAGAIVTPIAIIYSQKKEQNQWPSVVDDFDAQYGITKNVYEQMKQDFRDEYRCVLEDQWYDAETIEIKMNELNDQLKFFDEQFEESFKDGEKVDYSSLTKVLSDFARDEYGISLTRPSNMSYSDIDRYYLSLRSSNIIYMRSLGIDEDDIWDRIEQSDARYDEIISDLQSRYPNDTLSAWAEGSVLLYDCFAADNEFAALMSAQNKLKDFINLYNITYRTDSDIDNTFDSELVQNLEVGQPIEPTIMNQIFVFTEKVSGSPVKFKNNIIPNYTIVPVLHAKYVGGNDPEKQENANASQVTNFTNTYTLSIDWQIWSDAYVSNNRNALSKGGESNIVAHLRGDNPEMYDGVYYEDPIENINHCKILYPEYDIKASDGAEHNSLLENFFTLSKHSANEERKVTQYDVDFIWPTDADEIPYEAFWDGVKTDTKHSVTKAQLNEQGLANASLSIKVDQYTPSGRIKGEITPLSGLLEHKEEFWQTPDSKLSPEQIFVKYCSVGGIVDLENYPTVGEDNKYTVGVNLFTKYRNEETQNLDASCVTGEWSSVINAKISKAFYQQAANNFNKTREKYNVYFSDDFSYGVDVEVAKYFFKMAVSVTFDAFSAATVTCQVIMLFMTGQVHKIALAVVACALLASHMALLAQEVTTWNNNFFFPWVDFKLGLNDVRETDAAYELHKKISDDESIFPIWTDDETYNENDDYKNKEKAFNDKVSEWTFNGVLERYCDFYSNAVNYASDPTLPIDPMIKEFNRVATLCNIGPDQVIGLLTKFDEGEEIWDFLSDLEDKKSLVCAFLDFVLPSIKDDYKELSDTIGTASKWVKIINMSVKQILSYIKCEGFKKIKAQW